jgi:hypothetical protein
MDTALPTTNAADSLHMPTIGVINPWPGDISAEFEFLMRMKKAAQDAGIKLILLDNFGHILDEEQKMTSEYVDPHSLDFVITTHYETSKTIDSFYYHTLWNPPDIPLNLNYYSDRVTDNYIMNDDFLIYGSGGMVDHLKSMLLRKPRLLDGASVLTASFPESALLSPNLRNPILFYCGMNWERIVHHTNRHEGLFKLLDQSGKIKFFGPNKVKAWGNINPWEGYKCYQREIPFDGFSILREINKCGVCLVLASDIHRRANAISNRAYEACAAGAVIISDENEFMLHWFKDAALFITYDKNNPQYTYNQIMDKYDWIIHNREQVQKLVINAQKIFREHFALDKQLLAIVKNHKNRFAAVVQSLFAKDISKKVLVTYVVNTLDIDKAMSNCTIVIHNVLNQYYKNIFLYIICDDRIKEKLQISLGKLHNDVTLIGSPIFDLCGARQQTTAQTLCTFIHSSQYDYIINTTADEIWFYDHVTTLIRTIEDSGSDIAYSGRIYEDDAGYRRTEAFSPLNPQTLFTMQPTNWLPVPGQLLFTKDAIQLIPEFLDYCLDGYGHYAYVGLLLYKFNRKAAFSERMTFAYKSLSDFRNTLVPSDFQIRFIRDLLKDYIPASYAGEGTSPDRAYINDMMAKFQIKTWLKFRFFYKLINIIPPSGNLGKFIEKKYTQYYNLFIKM